MNQGQHQPARKTVSSAPQTAHSIYSESGDERASVRKKAPASSGKAAKKRGKVGQLLEKIPFAAGIALCALLLCVSLVAGNARALSAATSRAMDAWEVSEYIDGRLGEARNLLTLCERSSISPELKTALEDAIDALDDADTRDVSAVISSNQALETAASNVSAALLAGELSASDEKALASTMDDFREQGNFLRQQAREYNEEVADALALYNKLPTQFLLSRPAVANIE